jgi:hypothetical protein
MSMDLGVQAKVAGKARVENAVGEFTKHPKLGDCLTLHFPVEALKASVKEHEGKGFTVAQIDVAGGYVIRGAQGPLYIPLRKV